MVDWPPDDSSHIPQPVALPPTRRPAGATWRLVFVALLVLIVVLVIAIWSLGGDDDSDDVATGTSAEPSDTADTGSESAQDPSGDTGVDGVGGDQPAQLDDDTTAAQPEEGTTTSTTSTTTTTIGIPTTTFTTTLPEDVDDYGPSTLDDNSTVSTVGLDSVHFGMTVQQAQEAAGSLMVPIAPVSACYHVVPHGAPEGIVFLVHSGTIERVDINSGPITTRSGVGVGTPDETVIDLFGASIEREVRPDGTVDLIFVPRDAGDANFRVIFNVADGRVRAFKSGRLPYILTQTGCEPPPATTTTAAPAPVEAETPEESSTPEAS